MKNALLGVVSYCLLVLVVDYGCGLHQNGSVKDLIPGIYVRSFVGEFSRGKDTLSIEEFSASTYTITHKVVYQRIDGSKVHAPERKTEQMTAIYDENNQVLRETKKGLVISFNPLKKTLLIGNSVFDKIK